MEFKKSFRDLLGLVVIILIMAMWIVVGLKVITMPGEIVGASIMGWTLVLQFYFRKKGGVPNGTTV